MSAPVAEGQRLFDVRSAAEYLKSIGAGAATVGFVRTLVNSGAVPHIRIGRKFYVSKAAIDRWIEQRELRGRK